MAGELITKSLIQPEGVNTPEVADDNLKIKLLTEAIGQTYNREHIQLKTELNKEQVLVFSKSKTFAKRYRAPLLDELTTNIMENSLSLNRSSRKEFERTVTSALNTVVTDDNIRRSLPDRVMGRGR